MVELAIGIVAFIIVAYAALAVLSLAAAAVVAVGTGALGVVVAASEAISPTDHAAIEAARFAKQEAAKNTPEALRDSAGEYAGMEFDEMNPGCDDDDGWTVYSRDAKRAEAVANARMAAAGGDTRKTVYEAAYKACRASGGTYAAGIKAAREAVAAKQTRSDA